MEDGPSRTTARAYTAPAADCFASHKSIDRRAEAKAF